MDITKESSVMNDELRSYWKDHGILKQHVRVVSLDDYHQEYDQLEKSDALVKCMIGWIEHPYCINVSFMGGRVENLFEVKEQVRVRLTLFVFESEVKKEMWMKLPLTQTHEIHMKGYELNNKIKTNE